MLLTLYHAASLLLASAASAIPLVRRSANGALAIWDDTPGPTCFSTANYSCDSKDLRAVASAFPVNLAIIAYPYPANISQQTVLGSGGNYSAKPGYPFEISWNVTDLDGQLHAYRLMDAGGEAAHSVLPGYTVPPDYCQYPHDQQMCWYVTRRSDTAPARSPVLTRSPQACWIQRYRVPCSCRDHVHLTGPPGCLYPLHRNHGATRMLAQGGQATGSISHLARRSDKSFA